MLAFPVSYELTYFNIPAAKVNDIAAWILLSDEIYMRDEINRRGSATVIRYQGKNGFKQIAEIPKISGTAQPYYGVIGGAYHFFFEIRENDVALRVEHFAGRRLNIEPYAVTLDDFPQFSI
jgi:hypothetical protein